MKFYLCIKCKIKQKEKFRSDNYIDSIKKEKTVTNNYVMLKKFKILNWTAFETVVN